MHAMEVLPRDICTNCIQTVDHIVTKVHCGDVYTVKSYTTLADSDDYYIMVVSPNTSVRAHIAFGVECKGETTLYISYLATVSDNGTEYVPKNRDLNSSKASTVKVYLQPSISSTGALLSAAKVGAGKNTGGSFHTYPEFILKQNDKCLFHIHNDDGANNWVNYSIHYYETTI